jgi:hypothetical protein
MCEIWVENKPLLFVNEPSFRVLKTLNFVVAAKEKRECLERKDYSLALIPNSE